MTVGLSNLRINGTSNYRYITMMMMMMMMMMERSPATKHILAHFEVKGSTFHGIIKTNLYSPKTKKGNGRKIDIKLYMS